MKGAQQPVPFPRPTSPKTNNRQTDCRRRRIRTSARACPSGPGPGKSRSGAPSPPSAENNCPCSVPLRRLSLRESGVDYLPRSRKRKATNSGEEGDFPLARRMARQQRTQAGERKKPLGDNRASELCPIDPAGQTFLSVAIPAGHDHREANGPSTAPSSRLTPSERSIASSPPLRTRVNGWQPRGRPPVPSGSKLFWQTQVPATPKHRVLPRPSQKTRLARRGAVEVRRH